MYLLRTIRNWGWSPILLAALAILALVFTWPIWLLATLVGIVLVLSLLSGVFAARQKDLTASLQMLRQITGHFNRRLLGDSPISIFAVISGLLETENREIWDWARACGMSQRVLTTWGNSFLARLETDTKTRRFDWHLHNYLNELWLLNNHYYEFVAQFHEIARRTELSSENRELYQRFVAEYNAFVQNFRENISELKKIAQTGIEPPSVNLAKELPVVT